MERRDFLKLSAGDESPFVVSLDAPPTVARYRVSFRTDNGIVPHIDRRGAPIFGRWPWLGFLYLGVAMRPRPVASAG